MVDCTVEFYTLQSWQWPNSQNQPVCYNKIVYSVYTFTMIYADKSVTNVHIVIWEKIYVPILTSLNLVWKYNCCNLLDFKE